MITELVPVKVDPATADEGFWKRFHELRRIRHAELHPDDPVRPDDVIETMMKTPDSFDQREYFEISRDGVMISYLSAETVTKQNPEYESNKHLCWADAYVRPDHRRQGVGTLWLKVIAQAMDSHENTAVGVTAVSDDGHAFLEWLGAQVKLEELESRIDLSKVDWAMLERWVREGQERSPQTRLEIYDDGLPEELWPDFAVQRSTLLNMIPSDDLDVGKIIITPEKIREWHEKAKRMGVVEHEVLTREADGTISGMTDVEWTPYGRKLIQQQFTGVLPSARGRGVGKWIKAAMLLHIHELYPDAQWVSTENAQSNGPMLAINRAMGFMPYRRSVEYQMSRALLEEKIKTL